MKKKISILVMTGLLCSVGCAAEPTRDTQSSMALGTNWQPGNRIAGVKSPSSFLVVDGFTYQERQMLAGDAVFVSELLGCTTEEAKLQKSKDLCFEFLSGLIYALYDPMNDILGVLSMVRPEDGQAVFRIGVPQPKISNLFSRPVGFPAPVDNSPKKKLMIQDLLAAAIRFGQGANSLMFVTTSDLARQVANANGWIQSLKDPTKWSYEAPKSGATTTDSSGPSVNSLVEQKNTPGQQGTTNTIDEPTSVNALVAKEETSGQQGPTNKIDEPTSPQFLVSQLVHVEAPTKELIDQLVGDKTIVSMITACDPDKVTDEIRNKAKEELKDSDVRIYMDSVTQGYITVTVSDMYVDSKFNPAKTGNYYSNITIAAQKSVLADQNRFKEICQALVLKIKNEYSSGNLIIYYLNESIGDGARARGFTDIFEEGGKLSEKLTVEFPVAGSLDMTNVNVVRLVRG